MSDVTGVVKWENNIITKLEENSSTKKLFSKFNKVFICGRIDAEFEFSHNGVREQFYRTRVRVKRLSETEDFIPIVVSASLIGRKWFKKSLKDKWVGITGQFRSYNKIGKDGRQHLDLFLFATAINIYDNEYGLEEVSRANLIYLEGNICKPTIYRKTLLGMEITDLMIAVHRPYGKSDYIPCISWGRMARFASGLEVGDRVRLYGRIQSRKYFKRFSEESEIGEYRDAYEISISKIQRVEEFMIVED